ncbi:uncharacterized protein LOC143185190 [Calliopsis andreniformis]|uniref:uncharacterized protein LOC143185190 n=1 Tax=Calliopsis andreniformis TaxID=337506 RepID=UPI003FCD5DC7
MACFTEWGGMNEIQAMSLLYKREFIIFNGQKQIHHTVTNNGFKDAIYLCHTPQKQYETIYTRDFVASAAYCQSIVYRTLYKDVFQMSNIESTVYKMLHDRSATFRHDKFFLKDNVEIRDRLTAEIYNKVENGSYEGEDVQTIVKNIPPFPYRVAKALDPNIYRNTDFDIWHEIRREVKNAGWTRHNSHELQIGGKCLVQMDFNEEEFDKANNNIVCVSSLEKDINSNDAKALQKKGKQDPTFFYGHIQEMSKNQGPVLVFIEELGEKRIVPYCALKPLPLKKSKHSNWLPVCKRNVLIETTQKWKKMCGPSPRKFKQSLVNINILSNDTDRHGNNNDNVNDINKNNFQWNTEALKLDQQQAYDNYTAEKGSNYSVQNSSEMYSTRMILDNGQSSAIDVRQENGKTRKERNSFANKNSENKLGKNSKSDDVMNMGNNDGLNSYSKQRIQNEAYCPPYPGDSVCASQMDQALRSVNCSVQKSVDINGSDLPLSDPFTLRFFYNLGLEYFRGNSNWNYLTNGQSPGFEQWYQGVPQNEDEIMNITSAMQNCTLSPQKREHGNEHKDIGISSPCQENGDKCVNSAKDGQIQKSESLKEDSRKSGPQSQPEKVKEQNPINKDSPRINKNGTSARFKKNSDRQRGGQNFPQSGNQYSSWGSTAKSPKSQEKGDASNYQRSRSLPQVHAPPTNPVNSYQTPYMQQGMYSPLPYYGNEVDAFANSYYPPNPGIFPISCLPPSDMPDNNNVQTFTPHMYPGVDYAQAYSGLFPPFMCPPPASYNVPPPNIQEHWYAVAGQPHYMQYAPVLPVPAEPTCNGIVQGVNQNTSP